MKGLGMFTEINKKTWLFGNVANSVKVKVKGQIKSLYFCFLQSTGLDHSTSCDGLS